MMKSSSEYKKLPGRRGEDNCPPKHSYNLRSRSKTSLSEGMSKTCTYCRGTFSLRDFPSHLKGCETKFREPDKILLRRNNRGVWRVHSKDLGGNSRIVKSTKVDKVSKHHSVCDPTFSDFVHSRMKPRRKLPNISKRAILDTPPPNSPRWLAFDDSSSKAIASIVKPCAITKKNFLHKMSIFEEQVYNITKDYFGTRDSSKRKPALKKYHRSRILNKIKNIKKSVLTISKYINMNFKLFPSIYYC